MKVVELVHQQLTSIGDCVRDLEFIANAGEMVDFVNYVQYLPLQTFICEEAIAPLLRLNSHGRAIVQTPTPQQF
jgi:hypothetical protein